jgi:hypothetical protein
MLTVLSLCEKSRSRRRPILHPYSDIFEDDTVMLGGLDHEATSLLVRRLLKTFHRLEYLEDESLAILASVTDLLDRYPLAVQSILGSVSPRRIFEDLLKQQIPDQVTK